MKFTLATATAIFLSVPALINGAPTASDMEKRQNRRPTTVTYDDLDWDVSYYGDWTHLKNQGYQLQRKTESYTGQPGAEVHFPNPLPAGDSALFKVTVFSTKKGDRGVFNVYCGHQLIGSGNEYSRGGETNSGVVFETDNIDCADDFVVKNDRGAEYLAIDAFRLEYLAPLV